MNNPLIVFNSILEFVYVWIIQHFQKIIEIFDNIHFGKVIYIYPLHITFIRRNNSPAKIRCFKKQYYISAIRYRELFDPNEFGVGDIQPGFFLHFSDYCINK